VNDNQGSSAIRLLVTGANGFIGRNLCVFLKKKGYFVRGAVRNNMCDVLGVDEYVQVGDINESTDWRQALRRIDVVVHLAGRAHVLKKHGADSVELFRKVNVLGTEHLVKSCVEAGVRRIIFISSVKVNGEGREKPYSETDMSAPEDSYGISKLEAEKALVDIAIETSLEVVILRIPLIYGPGVKANFKNLIKISAAGFPLPLKSIINRRSFLYVGNLSDAIVACIENPAASGNIFLVSDGEDISVPGLIKMIAEEMGRPARLFSFPYGVLRALCSIIGKKDELDKLTGTLLVDSSKIRRLLAWNPPFTLEEGIRETVKGL
jgi:nucleoside-diphosphate-sugar epimerase